MKKDYLLLSNQSDLHETHVRRLYMITLKNIASQLVETFVVYSDQYLVASGLSEPRQTEKVKRLGR